MKDREHVRPGLREFPLDDVTFEHLIAQMPTRRSNVAADRVARFEAGLAELRAIRAQTK